MNYTVTFNHEENKRNLIHQCNDYDQAEHFFWAVLTKMKSEVGNFDLILSDEDKIFMKFDKTL